MKKISIMLLAALMLFAFVACDDKTPEVPAATAEEAKLAGDFIDTLNQETILTDLKAAISAGAAGTQNGTMKATAGTDKAVTVTLAEYVNGTKTTEDIKTKPSISGTVVVTIKDSTGALDFSEDKLAKATGYDVTVTDVKFVSGTNNVTMSFKASGTIAKGVISVPAASAVTDLKVLFNGTEKSVTWAEIYKNTDQGTPASDK